MTLKRYVVRAGPARTVREVLAEVAADSTALAEGRVFVGRRRVVHDTEIVCPGAWLEIAGPLEGSAIVSILCCTEDLVAVDKPAGIPTIPDHQGSAHSVAFVAAKALGVEPAKLHATSRLDREVSGVVVFALTREAALRLARARARGEYKRRYLAITTSSPRPASGVWTAPIGRATDPRRRRVDGKDSVRAETRYTTYDTAPNGVTLLEVEPVTGRTHQIRVHAAHAGSPILGDRAYGASARIVLPSGQVLEPGRIALHALEVEVAGRERALKVSAPIPTKLREIWSNLGGESSSWNGVANCVGD